MTAVARMINSTEAMFLLTSTISLIAMLVILAILVVRYIRTKRGDDYMPYVVNIVNCSSCGGYHARVNVNPLESPTTVDGEPVFGICVCPNTNEEVYVISQAAKEKGVSDDG